MIKIKNILESKNLLKLKEDDENKNKESILYYSNKLKNSNIIKNQKNIPEPGFDFRNGINKFYLENYTAKTKNGSFILAIPNGVTKSDILFIKSNAIPLLEKNINIALKNNKKIVYLGTNNLPYNDGIYSLDIHGKIAKILNIKYGNKIKYDKWVPDYNVLMDELKNRTEANEKQILAVIRLVEFLANKTKETEKNLKFVENTLNSWGVDVDGIIVGQKNSIKNAINFLYPDIPTLPNFIIITYIHLIRVNLIKLVINYELKGYCVFAAVDKETIWLLSDTFKKLWDEESSEEVSIKKNNDKNILNKKRTSDEG